MNDEPRPGLNDSPLPPPTCPTRSRPPVLMSAATAAELVGSGAVVPGALLAAPVSGAASLVAGALVEAALDDASSLSPQAASNAGRLVAARPKAPAARRTRRRDSARS